MSFSREYTLENDDELGVSPHRNETHRLPVMANMKTKTIGAIKARPKQSQDSKLLAQYASAKSMAEQKTSSQKRKPQDKKSPKPPPKRQKHTKSTPVNPTTTTLLNKIMRTGLLESKLQLQSNPSLLAKRPLK